MTDGSHFIYLIGRPASSVIFDIGGLALVVRRSATARPAESWESVGLKFRRPYSMPPPANALATWSAGSPGENGR